MTDNASTFPSADQMARWWDGLSCDEQETLRRQIDVDPLSNTACELVARDPLRLYIGAHWRGGQDPAATVVPQVVRMFILEQQV